MIKQLLWWYVITAPMLAIRAPIIAWFVWLGMDIWTAIAVEFILERPLFYWIAITIKRKVGDNE